MAKHNGTFIGICSLYLHFQLCYDHIAHGGVKNFKIRHFPPQFGLIQSFSTFEDFVPITNDGVNLTNFVKY